MKRISILFFGIFIVLLVILNSFNLFGEIDRDLNAVFIGDKSDKIFDFNVLITSIFNPVVAVGLVSIVFILLCLFKMKRDGFYIVSSMLLSTLINTIFKVLVKRNRPINMLIEQGGFSFPSGHSAASACFAASIYLIIRNHTSDKRKKRIACLLLSIFSIYVAFTRLYLGVHYFSDVTTGLLLGLFVANLVEYLYYCAGFIFRKDIYYMG